MPMTHGTTPRIGRADQMNALADKLGTFEAPEVLGSIPADSPLLQDGPQGTDTQWGGPNGTIDLAEGPPPWELEDHKHTASDARRYVDVPDNWTLRWVNPKLLEQDGWRDWQPVTVGDQRVKVKVQQMCAPDGNVRRGGATGDILAWMYTSWVLSRRQQLYDATRKQTASAVDRTATLQEEFKRGSFGKYLHLDSVHHPTHTSAAIQNPTD